MMNADAFGQAVERSAAAVRGLGISENDRVLLAVNNDDDGAGPVLAAAAREVGAEVASIGPRGRMRILRAIQELEPTVLVMTPCGAADFLARLHLEFLVDPEELGLERLVVTGEIIEASSYAHLAREFAVEVGELWCDPASAAAMAYRSPNASDGFTAVEDGLIELQSIGDGLAEWTVEGAPTGWVSAEGEAALPAPAHTIGDRLLVRGRFVSIDRIRRALLKIDGISNWQLAVDRPGTLDAATLHVVLNRPTLLENPMWASRINDAVLAVVPVHVATVYHGPDEAPAGASVEDERGHHLGARPDAE